MTEKQENYKVLTRLAFRTEGDRWNAYWTPELDSMEGAVLIGSILLACVDKNLEHRKIFQLLMKACFSSVIEDLIGKPPEWHLQSVREL